MVLKLSADLVVLWSFNRKSMGLLVLTMLNGDSNSFFFTERFFHGFNHQTHGLISDVQNGW